MNQNTDRDRVLDATDVVRLIGEHIALRPKGREYVGLCPFHDDSSPSMTVVPHKQLYKCFACGAGGNVIDFMINYHHMEYPEALKFLAERAGIELTPYKRPSDGSAPPSSSGPRKAELIGANTAACDFFRHILAHPEHGAAARAVIEQRGISDEMVERFQLGAAPDRWDGLTQTIRAKGQPEANFRAAGLIKDRSDGSGYDALRNRLVFPIHNQLGRVIAFGGRRIDDQDEPKYLNSSESAVFNKSATLYGLHQANDAIRKSGRAIVTEGYMDVIACHQAGVCNVIATLGTAMNQEAASVLRRVCDREVILLFDGDEAGLRAADRAVGLFFQAQVDVRIAMLDASSGAKDPDELLKLPDGHTRFQRMMDEAPDAISYRMGRLRDRLQGLGMAARDNEVQQELRQLIDLGLDRVIPSLKDRIVRHLAQELAVSEASVRGIIKSRRGQSRREHREHADATQRRPAAARRRSTEARALACVLVEPSLLSALPADDRRIIAPDAYPEGVVRELAHAVACILERGESPGLDQVLRTIQSSDVKAEAIALASEAEEQTGQDAALLGQHWQDTIADWKRLHKQAAPTTGGFAQIVEAKRARLAAEGEDQRAMPGGTAGGRGGPA